MSFYRKLIIASLAASAQLACEGGPVEEAPIAQAAEVGKDAWQVCIDGHPEVHCYQVKAVADDTDLDDDGLSNREEMELALDPRRADTDRDGLDDKAEIKVHLSSPTNVDSDGDAQGNQRLWDGAEVQAGLSPVMQDSDGDGLSDYREHVELTGANPAVADLPKLAMRPLRPTFVLTGSYAEGASFALGVTEGFAETNGIVTTEEVVYTEGESTAVSVGTEAGGGNGGFNFGVSTSVSHEWSSSTATGFSTAVSRELQRYVEESREYTEYTEATFDGGYFALPVQLSNEGDVATQINDLAMELFLRDGSDPSDSLKRRHIATLTVGEGDFAPMTIAPDTGDRYLVFTAKDIPLELARDALAHMDRLVVVVGRYEVRHAEDELSAQQLTDLYQATARVVIDYGPKPDTGEHRVERFRVAANAYPGTNKGMPVGRILKKALQLPFKVEKRNPYPWYEMHVNSKIRNAPRLAGDGGTVAGGLGADRTLSEFWRNQDSQAAFDTLIDELERRFDIDLADAGLSRDSTVQAVRDAVDEALTYPMLVGVDRMRGYDPGCRRDVWQRKWVAIRVRDGEAQEWDRDFYKLSVRPKDQLFLIRKVDRDEDGLDLRTELRWNTEDKDDGYCDWDGRGHDHFIPGWDTDGDGATDYEEIVEFDLASDPADPDTDGDRRDDSYELFRSETDPRNPDTDGDKISDYYDEEPLDYNDLQLRDVDVDQEDDGDFRFRAELPDNDSLDRVVLLRQFENEDGAFDALPPIETGDLDVGDDFGPTEIIDKCKRRDNTWPDCVKNGEVTLKDRDPEKGRARYFLLTRQDFGTPQDPHGREIYVVGGGAIVKLK